MRQTGQASWKEDIKQAHRQIGRQEDLRTNIWLGTGRVVRLEERHQTDRQEGRQSDRLTERRGRRQAGYAGWMKNRQRTNTQTDRTKEIHTVRQIAGLWPGRVTGWKEDKTRTVRQEDKQSDAEKSLAWDWLGR